MEWMGGGCEKAWRSAFTLSLLPPPVSLPVTHERIIRFLAAQGGGGTEAAGARGGAGGGGEGRGHHQHGRRAGACGRLARAGHARRQPRTGRARVKA